jgi:5-methylcytosine-specific restriction endonuclease McrA
MSRPAKDLHLLVAIARTDSTFRHREANDLWVGKCLLCNGPVAFDARTGEGASLEHIRARSRGGGEEPLNLAVVHTSCNNEKGRRWDSRRARSDADYERFVEGLLTKRRERFRSES